MSVHVLTARMQTDICSNTQINTPKGYVTSPMYPKKYPRSRQCTVEINVENGYKINIYLLDLYLVSVFTLNNS